MSKSAKKRKPVYRYPDFVSKVELESNKGKRYWLRLEIDRKQSEAITVILKNPSRANQEVSDKTVFNVSNYIYRNRSRYEELANIGSINIVNLMPHYLTESSELVAFRKSIIDPANLETISSLCSEHQKVIIAWGNHPKGLFQEYEHLKAEVERLLDLHQNQVFYVDRFSKAGNPKHGQVWGYHNELKAREDS